MTVRIQPRARSRAQVEAAPAKLVTTLLAVAAAGLVEAGRFRRGREYVTEGAVTDLAVEPGLLCGTVFGSRQEPYEVRIRTPQVPPLAGTPDRHQLAALTPDADDLDVGCSCPDDESGPCKHVAAVLLAFSAEAGDEPGLLVMWRCGAVAPSTRAAVGSRIDARSAPPQPPAPSPFAAPAWQAFFAFAAGELVVPEVVAEPLRLGAERLGQADISAMIRSAHSAQRASRLV